MEGPSLVIATEELRRFRGKKVTHSGGSLAELARTLRSKRLGKVQSWGKLLWLHFPGALVRVHFLMFGSYRINKLRENRIPKLLLDFGKDKVYFYSCSARLAAKSELAALDPAADLAGKKWSAAKALAKLRRKPEGLLCDLLMDQTIFAGLGNIMKNEILFRRRLHPETQFAHLSVKEQVALVRECRAYSNQFYEWKKLNVLKRHWLIMRKKKCPVCGGRVSKRETGKLARISHYCGRCQVAR